MRHKLIRIDKETGSCLGLAWQTVRGRRTGTDGSDQDDEDVTLKRLAARDQRYDTLWDAEQDLPTIDLTECGS